MGRHGPRDAGAAIRGGLGDPDDGSRATVGGLGRVVVLVEVVDDRWESPVKVTATEGVMT